MLTVIVLCMSIHVGDSLCYTILSGLFSHTDIGVGFASSNQLDVESDVNTTCAVSNC